MTKTNKKISKLSTLSLNQRISLFKAKLIADKYNDIRTRTKLLNQYPELFEDDAWQEMERLYLYMRKLQKAQNDKKKITKFPC